MTSQLTPEHTTTLPAKKTDDANERIYLQAWFWVALLGVIGMVLVTLFG
jgi:hypothetical protein